MSEEIRSGIYAWLREQTDEQRAEYLMSCLAPAPLSDLVTKDFLTAELSRFVTKDFLTAELSRFATKDDLAKLEAKVDRLDSKIDSKVDGLDARVTGLETAVARLDTKVDGLAAQRDEDSKAQRVRHYWLVGIGVSIMVPIWLSVAGVIGAGGVIG